MRSTFADLKTLTLPFGAGPTSSFILLDGVNGRIQIYRLGILVGEWDSTSLDVINPSNGSRIFLDPVTFGVPALRFDPPNSAGIGNYDTGAIIATFQAIIETPLLSLFSPNIPGETASRISLFGQNSGIAAPPRITLSPNDNGGVDGFVDVIQTDAAKTADFRIDGRSVGRGLITGFTFKATANSGGISADGDTDFAINNLPVIDGREIGFMFDSRYTMSAAGEWALELMVNGTKVDEVGYIDAAAAEAGRISGWGFWTPSATAATDDIVVHANEISGASTLTFIGAANTPRSLKPFDLGIP